MFDTIISHSSVLEWQHSLFFWTHSTAWLWTLCMVILNVPFEVSRQSVGDACGWEAVADCNVEITDSQAAKLRKKACLEYETCMCKYLEKVFVSTASVIWWTTATLRRLLCTICYCGSQCFTVCYEKRTDAIGIINVSIGRFCKPL